jgi:hypothetical protein
MGDKACSNGNLNLDRVREELQALAGSVGGALLDAAIVPTPVRGSALRRDGTPYPYVVMAWDNDAWGANADSIEDRYYKHAGFETTEEALACCRYLIDAFLERNWRDDTAVEQILSLFRRYGYTPSIVHATVDPNDGRQVAEELPLFSAVVYLEERARERAEAAIRARCKRVSDR